MVLNGWSPPLAIVCHGWASRHGVRRHRDAGAVYHGGDPECHGRSALRVRAGREPEHPASTIPRGGTLSIAYKSDLQHLDPAVMYDFVGIAAVRLMFEAPLT